MNKKIIDIEINDEKHKSIKNNIYYTIPQVADILEESDSRIRYWYKKYEPFFEANTDEWNIKFTQRDFNIIRYIKIAIDQYKHSHKQIKEYLKENKDKFEKETEIALTDEQNKIVEIIIENRVETIITNLMSKTMNNFAEYINIQMQKQMESIVKENMKLKQELYFNLQDVVDIKTNEIMTKQNELKNNLNDITSKLDKIELETTQKENQTIADLKNKLSERENQVKKLEIENQKSWWRKLFNK